MRGEGSFRVQRSGPNNEQQNNPESSNQNRFSVGPKPVLAFFHERPDSLLNVQSMGLNVVQSCLAGNGIWLTNTDHNTTERLGDHEVDPSDPGTRRDPLRRTPG